MLAEVTVDLDAVRANVHALGALVAPSRVAPVVKANAYGHGLVPVARALADVDRLCVYSLDEALALREAGVRTRLHVLGPVPPSDLADALAADVELTLWDDARYRDALIAAASRRDRRARVHAKIDTGVTRLGMRVDDAPARIAGYLVTPEIDVVGIFSHLAAAEELESAYTHEQLTLFERVTAPLSGRIERHLAASAAAMLYPQTRLDAVRAGIATYGIWPSPQTRDALRALHADSAVTPIALRPALSWRTQLVVIHDVPVGTSVGYGCTFHTSRTSRIGVLPIGYAEGIPRAAYGHASVLIDGSRAPLVGRICMNMCFVDVTGIPSARSGSRVTLIGNDGDERIDAEDWGIWTDSIAYEIVARLPSEIPRRYASAVTASARSIVPS